jgi:hypothetical protein
MNCALFCNSQTGGPAINGFMNRTPTLGTMHRAPTIFQTYNLQFETYYWLHITHHSLLITVFYTRYESGLTGKSNSYTIK